MIHTHRVACPKCRSAMQTLVMHGARVERCQGCGAMWFGPSELRRMFGVLPAPGAPLSLALEGDPHLPCPGCGTGLEERRAARGADLLIDLCPQCRGVLLDRAELPKLKALADLAARQSRRIASEPAPIHPQDAYAQAVATMARAKAERAVEELDIPPPGALRAIALAIGLPVDDEHHRVRPALVTMTLLGALALVFALQLSRADHLIGLAFVPSAFLRGEGLATFMTATFLHGGFAHLLGNAWLLWVTGDNVESRLGPLRFSLLYFGSALAAQVAVLVSDPSGTTPYLGASGAIAGVMGAYMVMFPHSRIWTRFWITGFRPISIPAVVFMLGWVAIQFLGAFARQKGIAFWAHLGGFAMGALAALLSRRPSAT